MKILFSPSKTLAKKPLFEAIYPSVPRFEEDAKAMYRILSKFSKSKLSTMMKLEGKLLDETHAMVKLGYENHPKSSALRTYTGLAYRQLEIESYTQAQWAYLKDHVCILSALYGILRPEDQIVPYRLDFTMTFPKPSLRQRWTPKLLEVFKEEDWILNCASEEFSSLLSAYADKMHTVIFYDEVKGQYKVNSAEAKKARGAFLNRCVLQHVQTQKDLASISLPNYRKELSLSSLTQSVFIRIQ